MNTFPINQYLKNKDMETNYIDFIWSSQKEYFSLKPLYDDLNTPGYITNLHKLFDKTRKGELKDKEIFIVSFLQ